MAASRCYSPSEFNYLLVIFYDTLILVARVRLYMIGLDRVVVEKEY